MSNLSPGPSEYYQSIHEQDAKLKDTLAAIHADEQAGHLTVREAADNRIAVLEAHLARCRELRARHFPEIPESGESAKTAGTSESSDFA